MHIDKYALLITEHSPRHLAHVGVLARLKPDLQQLFDALEKVQIGTGTVMGGVRCNRGVGGQLLLLAGHFRAVVFHFELTFGHGARTMLGRERDEDTLDSQIPRKLSTRTTYNVSVGRHKSIYDNDNNCCWGQTMC